MTQRKTQIAARLLLAATLAVAAHLAGYPPARATDKPNLARQLLRAVKINYRGVPHILLHWPSSLRDAQSPTGHLAGQFLDLSTTAMLRDTARRAGIPETSLANWGSVKGKPLTADTTVLVALGHGRPMPVGIARIYPADSHGQTPTSHLVVTELAKALRLPHDEVGRALRSDFDAVANRLSQAGWVLGGKGAYAQLAKLLSLDPEHAADPPIATLGTTWYREGQAQWRELMLDAWWPAVRGAFSEGTGTVHADGYDEQTAAHRFARSVVFRRLGFQPVLQIPKLNEPLHKAVRWFMMGPAEKVVESIGRQFMAMHPEWAALPGQERMDRERRGEFPALDALEVVGPISDAELVELAEQLGVPHG